MCVCVGGGGGGGYPCSRPSTFYKMRTFVRTLYKYDFEGEVVEEEEEEEIVIPVEIDNDEDFSLGKVTKFCLGD